MMATVGLGVIGVLLVVAGVRVVRTPDLVHAVFWLAAVLIGTAALFVGLEAPFLAGIQIVLYTGGVITLMLFGVMLTHRELDARIPNPSAHAARGLVTAGALATLLLTGIWTTDWSAAKPAGPPDTARIGKLLMGEHLVAFEALSILLLVAMIGAIALARRTDP